MLNPLTEEGKVDLVGIWKGFYTYNMPNEFKDEKMQKVEFIIKIGKVKGSNSWCAVEDNNETGGTHGVGQISGKYTDEGVQFDKNMPIHTVVNEKNEHISVRSKKHPTMAYTGDFSRSKKRISGYWAFKKKKLYWKGLIQKWLSNGNGHFEMHKQE